jgi:two-component system, LytTR family, sensor kinase
MKPSSARFWAIFAGYTALGLFIAAANSLTYMSNGGPPYWLASIKRSLGEWYGWAALTPLILHLANRRPIHRGTIVTNGGIHLGVGVAVAVFKVYLDGWLRQFLFGRRTFLLASGAPFNFLIYWMILAAAHGLRYYHTSRERELRASQLEARLAETRLMLLSMQLQPHFLFNTLNAISELVHEDPETADRMISGLSLLLRETLEAGAAPEVDLRRELHLLGCYIDIQRARFGDRLRITLDVDPRVMDATIPMLLLQPLVENAIRHGLSRHVESGRIEVAARPEAGRVVLTVRDDGRGLSRADRPEGIGLGNTRARLEALFGDAFLLDMTQPDNGGVQVSVSFPYRPVEAV